MISNFSLPSGNVESSPVAMLPADPSHTLTGALGGEAAGEYCSFCGRPATMYHVPLPVNGRWFPRVPTCGGKCARKKSK